MRKVVSYDQFTCHTDVEFGNCKEQFETPATSDIRTMDSCKNLKTLLTESNEALEQQIVDEKEYIKLQNQIRVDISSQLQFKVLSKLDLKCKEKNVEHPIHNLFRWIISVFYRCDEEVYEWNDFRKNCIQNDQGKDLSRRLGYMNVVRITKLEHEKTKVILKRKLKIEESVKNNKDLLILVAKLFDIIQIIMKTYDAGQKILKIQEELVKRTLEEDEQVINQ